ncbi:MAG: molybdopterin-dependent oxidoreductase [Acidobacteria bacterium]|nr:molybdopterin-dependent oxidoreductase [Acidobacteriota bacterium]
MNETEKSSQWHKTACILCSLNCGIEVQLDENEPRHIARIRGDKAHPISRGYTCEKPQRLDFYQNAADRLTSPLRRRPDGTFEPIDWETAIAEIADKLGLIRDEHGGESIFYYGGGGQANHLGGTYADSVLKALGSKFRSNALAQEKTGEFWVQGKMMGTGMHSDFEHCEVAIFIGKNPWQSHGFNRARVILRQIAKDPDRSLIVIDPRRSETAELADYHLAIIPGTDAWCLAALAGILVQENLIARDWLAEHATGLDQIEPLLASIPVAGYAEACGVPEDLLRAAARRIAQAKSVSMMEDLGMQMSIHSTLSSYLQRMIWLLTGNFGRPGTNYALVPFVALNLLNKGAGISRESGEKPEKRSPVAGARIISGLVPCNIIPDEILTDHPRRYRAMIVESANPVHSLADSQRMREALGSLDLLVVIDVAMTETARLASYVLPAPTQYEKYEASYFNIEFPQNGFHLRRPVFDSPPGTLPEPEIHARIVEALGELTDEDIAPLKAAAQQGRPVFAREFMNAMATNPVIAKFAPVVLYRTLGPTLPNGAASAAVLWAACHLFVQANPLSARRAGFTGDQFTAAESLFDAILDNPSGVIFAKDEYEDSWSRVRLPDNKINLAIPEMIAETQKLATEPLQRNPDYPFVLSAGERRSESANTIIRNPDWRKKSHAGLLHIHPQDAANLGLKADDSARLSTRRGSADVVIEITDTLQPGHLSLPNGLGLDYDAGDGVIMRVGVSLNELTASEDRDFLAGTPWHKHVPARLEPLK